jgi:hypothetical protein
VFILCREIASTMYVRVSVRTGESVRMRGYVCACECVLLCVWVNVRASICMSSARERVSAHVCVCVCVWLSV